MEHLFYTILMDSIGTKLIITVPRNMKMAEILQLFRVIFSNLFT